MTVTQLGDFLSAASNNTELQKALQAEGSNPIEIARQAGYLINQNDLDQLTFTLKLWDNSSPQLRAFIEALAQSPELQNRLQQPGCDPKAMAAELGLELSSEDLAQFSPEVIELDDDALSQVTGGAVVEAAVGAAVGAVLLNVVVPMIHATAILAVGIGAVGAVSLGAMGVAGIVAYGKK